MKIKRKVKNTAFYKEIKLEDFIKNNFGDTIAILSAHDDDILPIACTIKKLTEHSREVHHVIVSPRRYDNLSEETEANKVIGIPEENTHFLDIPTEHINYFLCIKTPDEREGAFLRLIRLLRRIKPNTVLIQDIGPVSNDYHTARDFHVAHKASYEIGVYSIKQSSEPVYSQEESIMPVPYDLGHSSKKPNVLVYRVTAKISYRDNRKPDLLVMLEENDFKVQEEYQKRYKSQEKVIKSLVKDKIKEEAFWIHWL